MRRGRTLLGGFSRFLTGHGSASGTAATTPVQAVAAGAYLGGPRPALVDALPCWLASCLRDRGSAGCSPAGAISRSLWTSAPLHSSGTPETPASPSGAAGDAGAPSSPSTSDLASPEPPDTAPGQASRAKATPRHGRPPQPSPGPPLQPASRGAKDKPSKPSKPSVKQHSAKAAAWPPDGVQPPLPLREEELVKAVPRHHAGPVEGEELGAVNVVGYHFVHPISRDLAAKVVHGLISRSIEGAQLEGYHTSEARTLILLRVEAPGEAAAQEPEAAGPGGGVAAVVIHSYGGVAVFNAGAEVLLQVLARVAGALLEPVRPAGRPHQVRLAAEERKLLELLTTSHLEGLSTRRQDLDSWLCKEEQKILVNKQHSRWIQKDNTNNLYYLKEWDSTNLESISSVVTKSAALRYHDKLLDRELDRYDEVLPLVEDDAGARLKLQRWWLRRWSRGGGKEPLATLRQLVDNMTFIRAFLFCRLCVSEGPSRTWDSDRHYAVWDAMRNEYELDDRLEILMEKADLLKQSCLDRLSANASSFTKLSELIIIGLIFTEIVISLTDMHGLLSADNVRSVVASALGDGAGGV